MSLSRKHFNALAAIFRVHSHALNDAGDNGGADTWLNLRADVADFCARQHPRFDRGRFYRATDPAGKTEAE